MLLKSGLIIIWSALALAGQLEPHRSLRVIGDCRSNDDCAPSGCCLLGMMRYSTPWCAPVLQFGETCRPSGVQLTNITLNYPGGLEIHVKDAYQILCPCDAAQGLVCSPKTGTCVTDDVKSWNSNIVR